MLLRLVLTNGRRAELNLSDLAQPEHILQSVNVSAGGSSRIS